MRVCEDVCRFLFNEKIHTRRYKNARHRLSHVLFKNIGLKKTIILSRDTRKDVGKKSTKSEFKRNNTRDIFYANSQRIKESLRVLEEFTKLSDSGVALKLKKLRYKIYAIEQDVIRKF